MGIAKVFGCGLRRGFLGGVLRLEAHSFWLRLTRHGAVQPGRARAGQMTVELAVAMPVLIAVALIVVNGCTFMADCAVFDRVAHEAIRVYAPSPAYRQTTAQSCSLIEQEIRSVMDAKNINVSVACTHEALDFERFTATLEYSPTLFGIGMRSSVFGVELPRASHSTSLVVDVYKPGVVV